MDEVSNVYSARIGLDHRALGQMDGSDVVWFSIGKHREYDKML